uniref:Uncharacterized protein n=1 Tax=Hyaloperonospora arabidopsidis (strain Emoy2) TaxID=559515 RepID=M4C1M5_HYAAE
MGSHGRTKQGRRERVFISSTAVVNTRYNCAISKLPCAQSCVSYEAPKHHTGRGEFKG